MIKERRDCPICQNKCDEEIDNEFGFFYRKYKYNCSQCGKFILPVCIALLVTDINSFNRYKEEGFCDTYDRDKMIGVLREGINKYGERSKTLSKAIIFCCDEKEKMNDDRRDERIYLTWDEQYRVKEIK